MKENAFFAICQSDIDDIGGCFTSFLEKKWTYFRFGKALLIQLGWLDCTTEAN